MEEQLLKLLVSNGIDPNQLRLFITTTTKEERAIFELVRKSLPAKEANRRELALLNAEIFQSVIEQALLRGIYGV
jgi:hypothetical protein